MIRKYATEVLSGDTWRTRYLFPSSERSKSIALIGAGDMKTYQRCVETGSEELWDAYWLKLHQDHYCVYDVDTSSVDKMSEYGICCKQKDVCMEPLSELYDSIFLIDVIEHVAAPLEAMKHLAHSLTGDGRLIVSTPNCHYWGWFIRGNQQVFPEDHLQCFSKQLLLNLGQAAGLQYITSFYYQSMPRSQNLSVRQSLCLPFHFIARLLGKSNAVLVEFQRQNE